METGGEDGGRGSDVRGGDEGETLKNFKMKKKIDLLRMELQTVLSHHVGWVRWPMFLIPGLRGR